MHSTQSVHCQIVFFRETLPGCGTLRCSVPHNSVVFHFDRKTYDIFRFRFPNECCTKQMFVGSLTVTVQQNVQVWSWSVGLCTFEPGLHVGAQSKPAPKVYQVTKFRKFSIFLFSPVALCGMLCLSVLPSIFGEDLYAVCASCSCTQCVVETR